MRLLASLAVLLPSACFGPPAAAETVSFSPQERQAILQHGPWPPSVRRDDGNRFSGQADAQALGRKLFFDARLSLGRDRSCATCHQPARAFTESRQEAAGPGAFRRNTPSLLNVRFQRWYGWSGASDSLWAASLRPLAASAEMGGSERAVAARFRDDPDLATAYEKGTGRAPPTDDDALLADIGKMLAAYQETLVTPRTSFDAFRDALERGDWRAMQHYPAAARRGLKLFVGAGRCAVCHSGPLFTHGEFGHAGVPVRTQDGSFDWGRYEGVKALRASRFNLLSTHNDDIKMRNAVGTRHAALEPESYGAFRVPGLRGVARTAPYMHDGSLPTLESVVRHYASLDPVKLHIASAHPHPEPGEPLPPRPETSLLGALSLTDTQVADLVAFLRSLSTAEVAQNHGKPDDFKPTRTTKKPGKPG